MNFQENKQAFLFPVYSWWGAHGYLEYQPYF